MRLVVDKFPRYWSLRAGLVILSAGLALAACATSDEAGFDGPPDNGSTTDAHKDVTTDAFLCGTNKCPAPSTSGMIACCTTNNQCGQKPDGGTTCIALLPDGGGGAGGQGGMGP